MKTRNLVLVLIALGFMVMSCSGPQKKVVIFVDSVPKYAHVFGSSDTDHFGEMPQELIVPIEGYDRSRGYVIVRRIKARWASGAERIIYSKKLAIDGKHKRIIFFRPADAPNAEIDAQYETAKDRNKIMQKGVDEQGASRTQTGILGLGLLCIMSGHCR